MSICIESGSISHSEQTSDLYIAKFRGKCIFERITQEGMRKKQNRHKQNSKEA